MCFDARDYSYSAASFHAHCNNKGSTVTLVEVGHNVFGGYIDLAWTSSKCYDTTRSVIATRGIAKVFLVTDDEMTRYGLRKFVPQLKVTISCFPALGAKYLF